MYFWEPWQKASLFAGIVLALMVGTFTFNVVSVGMTNVLIAFGVVAVTFTGTWIGFAVEEFHSYPSTFDFILHEATNGEDYDTIRLRQVLAHDYNAMGNKLSQDMFSQYDPLSKAKAVTPKRRSTDGKRKRNH